MEALGWNFLLRYSELHSMAGALMSSPFFQHVGLTSSDVQSRAASGCALSVTPSVPGCCRIPECAPPASAAAEGSC